MKIKSFIIVAALLISPEVYATTYIEEMKGLGYVSGEGLACQAKRYPSYELIARAYMVTKAKSDKEQADGMYAYNEAKLNAYLERRQDDYIDCMAINKIFNHQKIFQSKLYKNGTIKTPDGKILKPRQKYNPELLYNRQEDERSKIDSYYTKAMNKRKENAQKQGIYRKIQQQEMKNRH